MITGIRSQVKLREDASEMGLDRLAAQVQLQGERAVRTTLRHQGEHYKVVFENDRVRVLEYTDQPGDRTTPHEHPHSVMYTLSSFRRRLASGNVQRDVELAAGTTNWLPAQQHFGENIGDTPTHMVFVELKREAPEAIAADGIGPS